MPKGKQPDSLQEVHLRLENTTSRDMTFVLEPWGEVHAFPSGDLIEVVGNGPAPGSFDLDMSDESMTVCGWPGSTVFLFRDGIEFAKGRAERPRVPVNAYPPSIAPLSQLPSSNDVSLTADGEIFTDRLLALLDEAGQQGFDRGAVELYLGRAVVEGLELAKVRKAG